jgi:serine/threonine-protein kinase
MTTLERLREVNARLDRGDQVVRTLWEDTPCLICIISREYFLEVNPRFVEVLGWSRTELLENPFLSLVHPEDRERTAENIRQAIAAKETQQTNFVNRYLTATGHYVSLHWFARIVNDQGVVYGFARPEF